jgi:hypothetical protein
MIGIAPERRSRVFADVQSSVMRVRRFTTWDELMPYADDWDRLAVGVPFRGWTWLSSWWRHFGPQTAADARRMRLAVLGVFDEAGGLCGLAPWYLDDSGVRGRVLRALGSGEVCSEYLGVSCVPAFQEAVLEALGDYLLDSARDRDTGSLRWDLLDLEKNAEDAVTSTLIDRLAADGCAVHRRPGMNCWRLDLTTEWEGYVASLGKNLRRELRQMERNFFDTGRAVLHSPTKPGDLPKAMDILVDLHQRRWTSVGEPGCFASARFSAFFRDVVPAMQRRGKLQFYWLELDGKPIAARYELVDDGVVFAYQSGVDPDASEHEPGKLMNLATLRDTIARGYRVFDFLRGDEPYKARFGAKPRPTVRLRVVPPHPVAQLRHKLWLSQYRAKQWVKSRIGRKAK